jgi:hypothetical protein
MREPSQSQGFFLYLNRMQKLIVREDIVGKKAYFLSFCHFLWLSCVIPGSEKRHSTFLNLN